MDVVQDNFSSVESEVYCLDSTRMAAKVKSLFAKFQLNGVDLNVPCGNIVNHTTCWIASSLADLNRVLCATSTEILEHAPGGFTLICTSGGYVDCESSYLDSAILTYWLLKCHHCIKCLRISESDLFKYFPVLLGKALRANKGLEEVEMTLFHLRGAWIAANVHSVLASALLSLDLKSLSIKYHKANVALQEVGSVIRRGKMQHLRLWCGIPKRTAFKLFDALNAPSCLSALDVRSTSTIFSRSKAILLTKGLERNKSLRKLSIHCMMPGVAGIILTVLNHNSTLEEVSLSDSRDDMHCTLWDGFEALRSNTSLRTLKLICARLKDSCAMVIADILRVNTALQELSLSENRIGNLGALALARALQNNSSLKRLDVSNCTFTEGVVSAFVQSLARNRTVECVRLGKVNVPEEWAPTLPLTADVCARLDLPWNTRGIEQWAACMPRRDQNCSNLRVAWAAHASPAALAHWFSTARVSCPSLTELVVNCPSTIAKECAQAFASFLEATTSLKKLIVGTSRHRYAFWTDVIYGLAPNKTVREATFCQYLHTVEDFKAIEQLLRRNRTLHRLTFFQYIHTSRKPLDSLAQALEDNFVFLSLDFQNFPDLRSYPLLCALNRNRSLLYRAVECVLKSSATAESMQALRLLSTSDSLADAVTEASGKPREECKRLLCEAQCRL